MPQDGVWLIRRWYHLTPDHLLNMLNESDWAFAIAVNLVKTQSPIVDGITTRQQAITPYKQ